MAIAAGERASEMRTRRCMEFSDSENPGVQRWRAALQLGRRALADSRGLGKLALELLEGVIEPMRQRFDIACFDGRAAPDAQARRRVSISADIVGDFLVFEQARERF